MAVATPAAGARETVRQRRDRDQELLVWPDLVFVEFIAAVLFTITFVILSTFVNAPLLNRANADITPNPSKAPWYFMNLQELLLHMDPGLAGVIVPTLLLVLITILAVFKDAVSWRGLVIAGAILVGALGLGINRYARHRRRKSVAPEEI